MYELGGGATLSAALRPFSQYGLYLGPEVGYCHAQVATRERADPVSLSVATAGLALLYKMEVFSLVCVNVRTVAGYAHGILHTDPTQNTPEFFSTLGISVAYRLGDALAAGLGISHTQVLGLYAHLDLGVVVEFWM